MLEQIKIDLAQYRLEKAEACLQEAEYLVVHQGYSTILNRAYNVKLIADYA